MLEAFREFELMSGEVTLASGEVRYSFTVTNGLKARTWANASDGFHPAEGPTVDVHEIHIRMHPQNAWVPVNGAAFDAFFGEVPDEWFLAQLTQEAAE